MVELTTVVIGLVASGLSFCVPILFASLAETVSEYSGVLYIGQEGLLAIAAATAVVGALYFNSLWMGLGLATIVSIGFGLVISFLAVNVEADQIMLGIGLILLGGPLASYIISKSLGNQLIYSDYFRPITNIPLIGEALRLNILAYLGFMMVPVVWFFLFRTNWGLKLRAVGEDPKVADGMGINVTIVRYVSVIIASVPVAIGGAYLTIGLTGTWQGNPVAGSGILAVAVVRIGNWKPQWALGGAIALGVASAIGFSLQALGLNVASELLQSLPYIVGLASWAVSSRFRRWTGPKALGQAYRRQ
jgi:ABC-type uncharacterized transport system permease subunit